MTGMKRKTELSGRVGIRYGVTFLLEEHLDEEVYGVKEDTTLYPRSECWAKGELGHQCIPAD